MYKEDGHSLTSGNEEKAEVLSEYFSSVFTIEQAEITEMEKYCDNEFR